MVPHRPSSTLFPYTTLFRSVVAGSSRHPEGLVRGALGSLFHGFVSYARRLPGRDVRCGRLQRGSHFAGSSARSEEHTSELQSHSDLVCRLLLEKNKE